MRGMSWVTRKVSEMGSIEHVGLGVASVLRERAAERERLAGAPSNQKPLPLVYLSGPFSAPTAWGVEKNVRQAEEYALDIARLGAMPVCPHTNTRFFSGELSYEFWLKGAVSLMLRCDAVYMLPRWSESRGARHEHEIAIAECMLLLFDMYDVKSLVARFEC